MDAKRTLEAAFRAAVDAVDARRVTAASVASLGLGGVPITVLALGKAAAGMVQGFSEVVDASRGGIVVTDTEREVPDGFRLLVGQHPVPGAGSLEAGEALLDAAAAVPAGEVAIVLVSGGGSALAEALVPGVTPADLARTTELLLRSGAPIEDVNTVRIALSRLKGGGLTGAMPGVRVITLAISDVVGDAPGVIASGPTVAGAREPAAAVLERWGLADAVPATVRRAIGEQSAVVRSSGEVFRIVASRRTAAAAAAAYLNEAGRPAVVVDTDLTGEAATVATSIVRSTHRPGVVVYAGETTVTVTGDGRGGRNHEAALAAAIALDGDETAAFLAAGTDGVDGAAGGAGAVVDGTTVATALALGVDPVKHLDRNDSGGFFDVAPGRIETGRTGTNVGDVWMLSRRVR